jgi:triacylglycerol lipase
MPAATVRAPIVMVHGLLGFDRLRFAGLTLASYFADIPEALARAGNQVHVAQVSPTRGIAQRARDLQRFIDRTVPGGPIHIIAHSMGGLDARYMISRLGMEGRVLSLTTVGTPHRGTTFADWSMARFSRVLKPLLSRLDIPDQAFYDLTTQACKEFNASVPDAPGVRYFSVAGRLQPCRLNPVWQVSQNVVSGAEGPNDGLVSIVSARYGERCQLWEGDHLSLVNPIPLLGTGQGCPQDRKQQYEDLVRHLAEEGF